MVRASVTEKPTNQSAVWTSVPIKFEITYKGNSGESSGEETCEQPGIRKW